MNGDADVDPQTDFDKSCTVPRHSNLAQNYRRMIQTKRPASTAGLPAGMGTKAGTAQHGAGLHGTHSHPHSPSETNGSGGVSISGMVISSGTATIRRTPSSKAGVRRTPSNVGPIPIRPPIVPVKTPTVPDSPGFPPPPPETNGSQESLYVDDFPPGALDYMKASPKRLSLPTQQWGSAGGYDPNVYPPQPTSMDLQQQLQHEEMLLAANRHTLVEQIGELVASAHALGEGQFPFPSQTEVAAASQFQDQDQNEMLRERMAVPDGEDMLKTIRRGVRLRKSVCNDRSAPRIMP